jgi:hypothetical protein
MGFGWGVAVFGVLIVSSFLIAMARFNRVRRWASTTATITRCDYETVEGGLYRLHVGYRFGVAGRDYVGDRISLGRQPLVDLTQCQAWMERFAMGSRCEVCYDPRDPEENALNREVDPSLAAVCAAGLGVGTVLMLIGSGLAMAPGQ